MHEKQPLPTPIIEPSSDTVIKLSPIVFILRLVGIELIFVLLLVGLGFLIDFGTVFAALPFADIFSINILGATLLAVFQVLVIAISFISWNLESYTIKKTSITHRGGSAFGERELAAFSEIKSVNYTQNRLQAAYNYGTLKLTRSGKSKPVFISNISNPAFFARLIRQKIPNSSWTNGNLKSQPIAKLLKQKEGQYLEFKASFQWDYQLKEVNKDLKKAVLKNVAAFFNTTGGVVVIGVDDKGKLIGIDPDIQSVPKKNQDNFENVFNMAFNTMIGVEYRQYLDLEFQTHKNKTICLVTTYPSPEPVFLSVNGSDEFYIRTGNSSQPLTMRKAFQYIQTHFVGK